LKSILVVEVGKLEDSFAAALKALKAVTSFDQGRTLHSVGFLTHIGCLWSGKTDH
jgi:hypothetical protein